MNILEKEQWKLIADIYKEVWIAKEKNKKSIADLEFQIWVAKLVNHEHQINFLENNLEWYTKNKKLIDNLYKLFLEFEEKWIKKIT